MTLSSVDGVVVGQHPLVSRLLKGAYNLRPPQPCYSLTWDVQSVLDTLKSTPPAPETLKQLTQRLTMLLALTGARRCSELQKLDVRHMSVSGGFVRFTLPTLAKNQRPGDKPKEYTFPAFPDCHRLCMVRTITMYLERTVQCRPSDKSLFQTPC